MDARPTLIERVQALPLGPLRVPLEDVDAYVVGGTVRDLLAGGGPGPDIDIAVDGDLAAVLAALDPGVEIEIEAQHARFATARVLVGGSSIDLTRTRSESYPAPGALPEIAPAGIDPDLARRDFTVNAMAVPLGSPGELLDPFDGAADLRSRTLRVLHPGSFVDDPTRAIRAARYAARLGLRPDPGTLELLGAADLAGVSADRRSAELARLAREPAAPGGFELLFEWGVLALSTRALALIAAVDRCSAGGPWSSDPEARARAILLIVEGGEAAERALRLAHATPERPSEAVRLAAGHRRHELLLARAGGGEWIDDYLREWSSTTLEIDGEDLIAAGIPRGPAIGIGLRGALERKLDGGLHGGREAELELALELARTAI